MVTFGLDYCDFQDGICTKCGYQVENWDKAIVTRRFCDTNKRKYHLTDMDLLYNLNGQPLNLRNHYKGAPIFFIGSGPSLNDLDLSLLQQRHITTFAVNNVAADMVRPNIWMCCDDPASFHPIIWGDPSIFKIVSAGHARKYIRNVDGDGVSRTPSDRWAIECPQTACVNVTSDFDHRTYFSCPTAMWGREKGSECSLGLSGSRSTMLAAMKVIAWLGFSRIYLLGCDFNMTKKQPYAFEQDKCESGCKTNNEMYSILQQRLNSLKLGFSKYNIKIWNCTPGSKLTVFPKMEFTKAISKEKYPHAQAKTKGWYQ